MIHADDDRDLRELFAETHSTGTKQAPPFRRMWTGARDRRRNEAASPPPRPLHVAAGTALVLVVLAGAVLVWMPRTVERETMTSLTEWRAPSDVLLETPGIEMIRSLPRLEAGPSPCVTEESTESPASKPERRVRS